MAASPLPRGRLNSWSAAIRCSTTLAATLSLAVWWPAPAASETLVVNGRQVLGAPVPLEYPDGIHRSTLSADRAFLYVEHGNTLSIVDTRLWTVLSRPSIAAQFPDRVFSPLYVGLSAVFVRPHPAGVFVTVLDLASDATRDALIPGVDVSCVWGEMGYSTTERRVVFATRTELVAVDLDFVRGPLRHTFAAPIPQPSVCPVFSRVFVSRDRVYLAGTTPGVNGIDVFDLGSLLRVGMLATTGPASLALPTDDGTRVYVSSQTAAGFEGAEYDARTLAKLRTLPFPVDYVAADGDRALVLSRGNIPGSSILTHEVVARDLFTGREVSLHRAAGPLGSSNHVRAIHDTGSPFDGDGDGLGDAWERRLGLDPLVGTGADGPDGDPDGDGRTNRQERDDGTHPRGFHRRFLAEGSNGSFFQTRLALLNVGTQEARVLVSFDLPTFEHYSVTDALPVGWRRTLVPMNGAQPVVGDSATLIESDQPVVVDRTMSWDRSGYGSHAETASAGPATTWYFAEGSTSGEFSLFYLFQNPNDTPVIVTVRYLRPLGLPPIRELLDRGAQLAGRDRDRRALGARRGRSRRDARRGDLRARRQYVGARGHGTRVALLRGWLDDIEGHRFAAS